MIMCARCSQRPELSPLSIRGRRATHSRSRSPFACISPLRSAALRRPLSSVSVVSDMSSHLGCNGRVCECHLGIQGESQRGRLQLHLEQWLEAESGLSHSPALVDVRHRVRLLSPPNLSDRPEACTTDALVEEKARCEPETWFCQTKGHAKNDWREMFITDALRTVDTTG